MLQLEHEENIDSAVESSLGSISAFAYTPSAIPNVTRGETGQRDMLKISIHTQNAENGTYSIAYSA